jgi:hypothetical protein
VSPAPQRPDAAYRNAHKLLAVPAAIKTDSVPIKHSLRPDSFKRLLGGWPRSYHFPEQGEGEGHQPGKQYEL